MSRNFSLCWGRKSMQHQFFEVSKNEPNIGRSWDRFLMGFGWILDGFWSPSWTDFGILSAPKLILPKSRFFKDVSSETLFFDFMLRPKFNKNRRKIDEKMRSRWRASWYRFFMEFRWILDGFWSPCWTYFWVLTAQKTRSNIRSKFKA